MSTKVGGRVCARLTRIARLSFDSDGWFWFVKFKKSHQVIASSFKISLKKMVNDFADKMFADCFEM